MTHLAFRILVAILAFAGAASIASAEDLAVKPIQQIASFTMREDRAYLLLRIDTELFPFAADMLRVPNQAEMDAYAAAKRGAYEKSRKSIPFETFPFDYKGTPNLFALAATKSFAKSGKTAFVLFEVPAGEYVLYGHGGRSAMFQCFCLGTVGFKAIRGQITDLGTMLTAQAWKPSAIPELADSANLGRSAFVGAGVMAVALRPSHPDEDVGGLDHAKIKPARLYAVGPFVEPNVFTIYRLAPIPGVLRYDGGRVIDVATNGEALPR